jgi:hypothetical protein
MHRLYKLLCARACPAPTLPWPLVRSAQQASYGLAYRRRRAGAIPSGPSSPGSERRRNAQRRGGRYGLTDHPDRAIAADIGVAPNTVKAARDELRNAAQLEDTPRIGLDGKTRRMPTRQEVEVDPDDET